MSKRYKALIRSGKAFEQKDLSKSVKRNAKTNPYKKVSTMDGSNELAGKPKFMQYNTTFSRLLKLILNMSESEQLLLLQYAKSIIDDRTLPRNLCLIPASFKIKKRNYNGVILDLNSYGAYIDTNEPFPIGQEINLSFFNPFSHKNMQLDGEIVWSNTHGIGVSFNDWSRMRYIW